MKKRRRLAVLPILVGAVACNDVGVRSVPEGCPDKEATLELEFLDQIQSGTGSDDEVWVAFREAGRVRVELTVAQCALRGDAPAEVFILEAEEAVLPSGPIEIVREKSITLMEANDGTGLRTASTTFQIPAGGEFMLGARALGVSIQKTAFMVVPRVRLGAHNVARKADGLRHEICLESTALSGTLAVGFQEGSDAPKPLVNYALEEGSCSVEGMGLGGGGGAGGASGDSFVSNSRVELSYETEASNLELRASLLGTAVQMATALSNTVEPPPETPQISISLAPSTDDDPLPDVGDVVMVVVTVMSGNQPARGVTLNIEGTTSEDSDGIRFVPAAPVTDNDGRAEFYFQAPTSSEIAVVVSAGTTSQSMLMSR